MTNYINRHALLRKHKRKMKQKYGHSLTSDYWSNIRKHEVNCREEYGDWPNVRNGGYEYWRYPYLSGSRRYAKEATNGVIRAMYRDLLNTVCEDNMDDVQALNAADYRKTYDYDWTIW